MFGRRYFGGRYFAPAYFGDGGSELLMGPATYTVGFRLLGG